MTKSPALLAAAAAALLAGVTYRAGALRRSPPAGPSAGGPASQARALCPRGTLPDEGVCIPVPRPEPAAPESGDLVPRRPDRDANFEHYRLPVPGKPRAASAEDGLPPKGTALAVEAAPGAEVRALPLEGQIGEADLVHRGTLAGATLVLHVTAGETRREYLVLFGNLESPAPLERGATVAPSAVVGRAGPKPVLWGVRLLRPGVDPKSLSPEDLLGESAAVWVDPRNLLPAK